MMKHEKFYSRGGAALPCANDEGDPVIMAFKYEITEHFGDLPQNANGWAKQLNKISWMERTPKYDLREWSPDGTKMNKGVSFTDEELKALRDLLNEMNLD